MLQIPMYRLHSDRAKEFLSAEVKRWATMHQLMQTYTAGDEPEGNARTEREIGMIKARTRLLLRTSKSPVSFWPLAARQALEESVGSNYGSWEYRVHRCYHLVQQRLQRGSHGSIEVNHGSGQWRK